MQKRNYSRELEETLGTLRAREDAGEGRKRLLLHVCCAPCSSYVLEYLREYFDVTVYYYNPNITEATEYEKRLQEEQRLIQEYNNQVERGAFEGMHSTARAGRIDFLPAPYDPERYLEEVRGLENCREGGSRCEVCFRLRLSRTAEAARDGGYDFFTTSLTISPLKNAPLLNEIGEEQGRLWGVPFLPSDFKKKDGYKRSIELSGMFSLYRQNYCGCVFSRREAAERQDKAMRDA